MRLDRRKHKSWDVHSTIVEDKTTTSPDEYNSGKDIVQTSSWKKLRLLMWKNYVIQTRHKLQTLLELLIPLIFTIVLLILRIYMPYGTYPEPTHYPPFLPSAPPYTNLFRCDNLYYSPKNNVTDTIMNQLYEKYFFNEGLDHNMTGFDTEEELIEAYQINSGSFEADDNLVDVMFITSPVLAAIVFENDFEDGQLPQHLKYKLRFPSSLRGYYDVIEEQTGLKSAWFVELLYPLAQFLGPRARNKSDGGLPGYRDEGFLYLQNAVDDVFIRLSYASESGNANVSESEAQKMQNVNVQMQRFPFIAYSFDLFLFGMQGFLPGLMVITYIYPVVTITKSIVLEKEKRLKESMKMMGLPNWMHWVAWFIKSYIFLMIICILITFLLKVRLTESQKSPIIPATDPYLLFFIFSVASFSAICFCFFVSTFFSKASPAATGAAAMWVLFYAPYGLIQPRYNLLPFWAKLLCCFGTNIPISMGCQIISLFEGAGVGLQWNNIHEGSSPDDTFSMVYVLIMMVVNSILQLLITLYVEAVWPGEFGIPLPWNFCFKKGYWSGHSGGTFKSVIIPPSPKHNKFNFEQEQGKMKSGIKIKSLSKAYGKKVAVNNLSLDIYEGQITALLGHNGAGKTTTISILTGLFPPTAGTAVINGYDIHKDMDGIRHSLGICPQHNVLFDELTVAEHLEFFCLLKGMEKHKVDAEINRLLEAVGLESKRDTKSRALSGGMKRKLSVLIAFCAGSKIVLLDECTSGMDSGSRRNTWDLIQSEKKGRTIILSTHFMEEADVLGDRIAIMAEGELQCCGSSLFLKKRYGGGYNLIIVKSTDCVVDNITNLIKARIPEAVVDQNVGAELRYILPDSKASLFPDLFEELEGRRKELGIDSYGASITTMEEVFMRVLKRADSARSTPNCEDVDIIHSHNSHVEVNHVENFAESSSLFRKDGFERNQGSTRLYQQVKSMFLKKWMYVSRNKYLIIFQMVLPLIYLNVVFLALQFFPGFHNSSPMDVSMLDRYEIVSPTRTVVHCENTTSSICSEYIDYVSERYTVENLGGELVENTILKELDKSLTNVNYKYIVAYEERPNPATNGIDYIAMFNNQPYHGPPVALNFVNNARLRPINRTIRVENHPFPQSTLDAVKETGGVLTLGFQVGYNMSIALSFLFAAYSVFTVRERVSGCKHLQFVAGVRFWLFWGTHFVIDYFCYFLVVLLVLLFLNIHGVVEYTDIHVQGVFILIMSLFGLAVLPLTYCFSFLASNPTTAYSRLVVFYCFTGLAPMMLMVFLTMPGFYLDQWTELANDWMMLSPNYAMGQGVMQLSANYHLRTFCSGIAFLEDICASVNDKFCCQFRKDSYLDWERMGVRKNVVSLATHSALYLLLLLFAEIKLFKKIRDCFRKTEAVLDADTDSDIQDPAGLEDSDVLLEEDKIRKTDLSKLFKTESLVVRDLTKCFDKFTAVDRMNFAVKPGECFGLLGVNGAGKTTTFKQLTGDLPPTSGDAFIRGKSIRTELRQVHECIGYAPQFDGLIDEMTARETLRMYARLKGVPENCIDSIIRDLGEILLFTQHLDKWTANLSGGNKRKLTTACSMVGKPEIVLLDEPSTGMDPVAKRHLWNAVSLFRDNGISIVLTTHSLEEAEALCTRMGIMVNGRFRCLGSPQHLKNKFSKGYTLIAQTKIKMIEEPDQPFTRQMSERGRKRSSARQNGSLRGSLKRVPLYWETGLEDLRTFIEEAFPDCVLKDIHPGFVHYHVNPSENVSWGKMFGAMEEARVKFDLEAYSVGQTSLEQVFLNFSKAQINE